MGMRTTALLTEAEFLNLPDAPGRQEFRDGELIELPPPSYAHSELVKRIVKLLETVLHESRVWSETGFRLRDGRWIVPDVAVIWPDQARAEGYFQGSPMLAVEVALRGYTPDQLQEKIVDYLENGVAEILVIYPKTRTIMVYRPGDKALMVEPDQVYTCELAGGARFTPEYRTATDV